jgi:flavin-dependent dehydrogenase
MELPPVSGHFSSRATLSPPSLAAAQAIDAACQKGDVSQAALSAYLSKLDESFVGKDMRTYSRAPHFLENPHMYGDYLKRRLKSFRPSAFCRWPLHNMFQIEAL